MKTNLMIAALAVMINQSVQAEITADAKAATSREEFCAKAKDPNYFRSLFLNPQNLMAFTNQGGLLNGGTCWWHSMLTRSATYLTVYKPNLPKPDALQVDQIIKFLESNRGIVEIPGYQNFSEFSADNQIKIQAALNTWQITDGGLGFGWVRGLSGNSSVNSAELAKYMDETYDMITNKKKVVYQMLQIAGIASHAWLVVDMQKQPDGYTLQVVDSNSRDPYSVDYKYGMENFRRYGAVPYTSRNALDFRAYDAAVSNYCRRGMTAADLDEANRSHNF